MLTAKEAMVVVLEVVLVLALPLVVPPRVEPVVELPVVASPVPIAAVVVVPPEAVEPTLPIGTRRDPGMPMPLLGLSSSSGSWCVLPLPST